jgi:hypothetical protein
MQQFSESVGPLASGVEHAQQDDRISSDPVRNAIRRARNHEFPSSGHAPCAPCAGKALKVVDHFDDSCDPVGGGSGAVLRDVFGLRVQIGERASKPLNAHAVSSVSPFVELPRRWQIRPYRPRQGPFLFRRFAIHSALQIPGSLGLRQKNDCGPSLSTNGLVASLAWSRDGG